MIDAHQLRSKIKLIVHRVFCILRSEVFLKDADCLKRKEKTWIKCTSSDSCIDKKNGSKINNKIINITTIHWVRSAPLRYNVDNYGDDLGFYFWNDSDTGSIQTESKVKLQMKFIQNILSSKVSMLMTENFWEKESALIWPLAKTTKYTEVAS